MTAIALLLIAQVLQPKERAIPPLVPPEIRSVLVGFGADYTRFMLFFDPAVGSTLTGRTLPVEVSNRSSKWIDKILAASIRPGENRVWTGFRTNDFYNEFLKTRWTIKGQPALWSDNGASAAVLMPLDPNEVLVDSEENFKESFSAWFAGAFEVPKEIDPFKFHLRTFKTPQGTTVWAGYHSLPLAKDRKHKLSQEQSWLGHQLFWTDGKQIGIRFGIPYDGPPLNAVQSPSAPTHSRFDKLNPQFPAAGG